MSTSANELFLSKERERILLSLFHGKSIPVDKINSERYAFLIYYSLATTENGKYVISEKGIRYVLSHINDRFKFWFPTILSVLALIISVIALLR